MAQAAEQRSDTRSRIVDVAAQLLLAHGPAAVTTRAVAEAAGVQAPAIYRVFGDKDGLRDAVAEHVMAAFVSDKAAAAAAATDVDPLTHLRAGWDTQLEFSLANPSVFRLLSDPDRVVDSPAARRGRQILTERVHRVALTGRLRVGEHRAVDVIQAAGIGTIQVLLATPPGQRDPGLADAMYDAVLGQILTDRPDPAEADPSGPDPSGPDRLRASAVVLRAAAADLRGLSDAERQLMTEWLDRTIES